jgi:rhamnose utilization protein RhaD (predicted bifunctional aldolase and dehydrogenase)
LGEPGQDIAILAEGNASMRLPSGEFWVKASGFSLQDIPETGFVKVGLEPIMKAISGPPLNDSEVREVLKQARLEETSLMPSVETFMHAYLLSLPEVEFVGHGHPTPLLSLLVLDNAAQIARLRIFPDEVVCCGPAAAFVPYVDPGLPLALAIKESVETFVKEHGSIPKTIWLQNHGLIALGRSTNEVKSAMQMSVKAARVWLAATGSGRVIRHLTPEHVARIHTRPDEHYRQQLLWQLQGRAG